MKWLLTLLVLLLVVEVQAQQSEYSKILDWYWNKKFEMLKNNQSNYTPPIRGVITFEEMQDAQKEAKLKDIE